MIRLVLTVALAATAQGQSGEAGVAQSIGCLLCSEQIKACAALPYRSALDQAEMDAYLACGNDTFRAAL